MRRPLPPPCWAGAGNRSWEESGVPSLGKVINTNDISITTRSVISPAQVFSVFKIPCASRTRREKNNPECVSGTTPGGQGAAVRRHGGDRCSCARVLLCSGGCGHGGDRLCLSRPACVPRATSVHCEINWHPGGRKGFRDSVPTKHPLLPPPDSYLWLLSRISNNNCL